MQFNILIVLLFTSLISAVPVPNPQLTLADSIIPGNGPARSPLREGINRFINKFSTKIGTLAVSGGLDPNTPPATSTEGETVGDGLDLKPVEVVKDDTDTTKVKKPVTQEGNVLNLKPLKETESNEGADEGDQEPVTVPAPVTPDVVTA